MARIAQRFKERFGVVGSVHDIRLDDLPRNGAVPAVIAQCAEEGLVDGTTHETLAELILSEHVANGIGLAFYPEFVAGLDVVGEVEGCGFAGVGDDFGVAGRGDGADAFVEAELAREEIVPGGVAVVFGAGVAGEELFEGEVGGGGFVGDGGEVLASCWAEPAVGFCGEYVG